MTQFGSPAEVEQVLEQLGERGYARRLARRPGQKEDRFAQLLGGEDADSAQSAPSPNASAQASPQASPQAASPDSELVSRVAALERQVAALRAELAELRGATDEVHAEPWS
jgi:uncharacterized protein YceH (UPF0502 family)